MSDTHKSSHNADSGSRLPNSDIARTQADPQTVSQVASKPMGSPSRDLGKGGCWTCRLRRKKCDEVCEKGSCKMCKRLHIDCLGWGSQRPDWMKDHDEVKRYRERIKKQLLDANLVRGVPRNRVKAFTGQQRHRTSISLSDNTTPSSSSDSHTRPSSRSATVNSSTNPSSWDEEVISHSRSDRGLRMMATGARRFSIPIPEPMENFNVAHLAVPYTPMPSLTSNEQNAFLHQDSFDVFSSMYHDMKPNQEFPTIDPYIEPYSIYTLPAVGTMAINPPTDIRQHHTMYYYNHIRKVELPFTHESTLNITYALVMIEPHGSVANAICALSSLYQSRMRFTQQAPNFDTDEAMQFYNESVSCITNSQQTTGQYTDADAIAALHLINFSLWSGGSTDWQVMLGVMRDWMARTGMTIHEDPMLLFEGMSETTKFGIKMTIWLDIISSVSLRITPRYLRLYRLILADDPATISLGSEVSAPRHRIHLETLVGCPDEVALCLAEVSNLACWKTHEVHQRTLSVRTLVHQGDAIERRLRTRRYQPTYLSHSSGIPPESDTQPCEETRQVAAELFREGVALYLHTITSGSNPGVPEIKNSVASILARFQKLSTTAYDRALLFPLCIGGCMSDDVTHRETFNAHLQSQEQVFGNVLTARSVMESVWQQRDANPSYSSADWRAILQERGHLLFM